MKNFSAPEHLVESLNDSGPEGSFIGVDCGKMCISCANFSDKYDYN